VGKVKNTMINVTTVAMMLVIAVSNFIFIKRACGGTYTDIQ